MVYHGLGALVDLAPVTRGSPGWRRRAVDTVLAGSRCTSTSATVRRLVGKKHALDIAPSGTKKECACLTRNAGDVRREEDAACSRACQGEERIVVGGRLGGIHVDRCAAKMARVEGCGESGFIDDATAGGLDENRAALHQREFAHADETLRGGEQRNVQGDDVSRFQKLIERDKLCVKSGGAHVARSRIEVENVAAMLVKGFRNRQADDAETYNSGGETG